MGGHGHGKKMRPRLQEKYKIQSSKRYLNATTKDLHVMPIIQPRTYVYIYFIQLHLTFYLILLVVFFLFYLIVCVHHKNFH